MTIPQRLTTQQKIAILAQKRSNIIESSSQLLEDIAIKENGIAYIPTDEKSLVIVQQLMNEGVLDRLLHVNNNYDRMYITMKGYSKLLDMLDGKQKDETREYQRTHAQPNAFDIQHRNQQQKYHGE